MKFTRRCVLTLGVIVLPAMTCVAQTPAQPASTQLKVLMSGGFLTAFKMAAPDFERTHNVSIAVTTGPSQGKGPATIGAQLARGVPADVVILSREGLAELNAEGRVVTESIADLAATPLALVVRAGAPKPNIATVAAFKQVLLNAKSIVLPGSTSSIYLADQIFPKLQIPANKVKRVERGPEATGAVIAGEAEFSVLPLSEVLHVNGLENAGLIPQEVQFVSTFSAAIVKGSTNGQLAKQLIAYLGSDKTQAAIEHAGMERPKGQK